MAVSSPIPHDLQLVIDFVNTRDLEDGTEAWETPEALAGWLRARSIEPGRIGADELAAAVAVREALREVAAAHNGGVDAPQATEVLDRAAAAGQLSVRFNPDGSVAPAPRTQGFTGALARVLVPVAQAAADGTWLRVKACRDDECQWAFYDASRNRSGRWCNMAVCGNRTKVRAYRERRALD
jgi:predicted RNA-binding Zn ribbon-like protein